MRLILCVLLGFGLCGCGKPKYEFESFDWPKSASAAKVIFYTVADETSTNTDPKWSKWMPLQDVLGKAQNFGWEYIGSVGDTCLLRRPIRATPTDPAALTGRFVVETLGQ